MYFKPRPHHSKPVTNAAETAHLIHAERIQDEDAFKQYCKQKSTNTVNYSPRKTWLHNSSLICTPTPGSKLKTEKEKYTLAQ